MRFLCSGTLIDRQTVLTAAQCVPKSLDYAINNELYTIPVETNEYYPTVESMLSVYFGVYNRSEIDINKTELANSTLFTSIRKVIIVSCYLSSQKPDFN
jgi:hypothetical protein